MKSTYYKSQQNTTHNDISGICFNHESLLNGSGDIFGMPINYNTRDRLLHLQNIP